MKNIRRKVFQQPDNSGSLIVAKSVNELTSVKSVEKASPTGLFNGTKRILRKNGGLLLMVAPGVILLIIFAYLPMFGAILAFKDYKASKGIFDSEWIGFKNFQYLFSTSDAWHVTFNTLFLNTIFIVTTLIGSLTLALLLNEIRDRSKFLAKFYQSALFFPYFMSWVIVSFFVFGFLNSDSGLLNQIFSSFGLDTVSWYKSPEYWPGILTLVNLWKQAGFWSVVYLAAMLSISPEYYEAAKIDGATKWKQITHITLPLLLPIIIINVLLSIGRIFYADFGLFYNVTRDNSLLYPTTDVIDTYVFRSLRVSGDVGMASAAGLYQSVVGFVLVILANWFVRRADPEKALF